MNFIKENIEILQKNKNFTEINLKKGEILFDEGESDDNIYIIISGELSVSQYTNTLKNTEKELAILTNGDFFGEGALKNKEVKGVKITATKNTSLLAINAVDGIEKLIKENPVLGKKILIDIIDITNKRLMNANKQITSAYEIITIINNLKQINYKSFFGIIDKINSIIPCENSIYIEKHKIIENIYTIKYNSKFGGKIQNIIFENKAKILNIDFLKKELKIIKDFDILINKINIGGEILGYIVNIKKTNFSDNEKRTTKNIATTLTGVIKQLEINKEIKNINHLNI